MNTRKGWSFNMSKVHPVLLAGGSGTRLWPLSRKSYPKHRLKNPGGSLMVLIEVQIGTYLGEDDIARYEDVYLRNY
jgi:hypothetical protein